MRLFVAVNFPPATKAELASLLAELSANDLPVRWVDSASLHVTLKFLGEVSDSRLPAIQAGLPEIAAQTHPFQMTIGEFGAFPSAQRARVFWLGVSAPAELFQLQQQVDEQFATLGFSKEQRAFQPHVTLGRVRNNAPRIERADVDRIAGTIGYKATINVASIELMRSHLSPRGARYEVVTSALLAKGG